MVPLALHSNNNSRLISQFPVPVPHPSTSLHILLCHLHSPQVPCGMFPWLIL